MHRIGGPSDRNDPRDARLTADHGRYLLALLVLLWLVSVVLWIQPGVLLPDGAGYLAWLPSTWLDRDLVFFDQWARFNLIRDGVILHKEVTVTSHLGNHWTSGSAVFWYPCQRHRGGSTK